MAFSQNSMDYDLQNAIHPNRLVGLWRLMTGYHWRYLGANLSLGVAALAKTSTYLLLRYFVDHQLIARDAAVSLWVIALGFVLLAVVEEPPPSPARLAASSAEGIASPLAELTIRPHPAPHCTYHTKRNRRVDPAHYLLHRRSAPLLSEQAIGIGRSYSFHHHFVASFN